MMFNRFYGSNDQMNTSASALCANAASCCAQTASANANTVILSVMDAMILASIIIFALICALITILGLRLVSLLVVLVLAGLVICPGKTPWFMESAV